MARQLHAQGESPVDRAIENTVTFRCPPELAGVLPRPIPAVEGLPDWFKTLPQKAVSADLKGELLTIKKCPPVIDAMTYGFFIPLAADLKLENGEFSWQTDWPSGEFANITRSPISFHDSSQVAGTPFFDEDQFIIKFNNFWTIQLPPGYSILITHPINRDDLPFRALTGLVDCDRYFEAFMQFPARWVDPDFNGVLPKGTPVVQCLPVKRENWSLQFAAMTDAEKQKVYDTSASVAGSTGVYRHQFRALKR
jgi:hypothetical protein